MLIGAPVLGSDEKKIGTVGEVYVDSTSGSPSWVTITTGLFGSSQSFAPLDDANWDDESVRLPFEKEFVKDAPRIEDDGTLKYEDEGALYSYYSSVDPRSTTDNDDGDTNPGNVDADLSAMRSADQRLRKYVVTENKMVSVPVEREEVRLQREPNTDHQQVSEEIRKEEVELVDPDTRDNRR